ncbi:MAG: 50S ribosomal protein L21 [Candidatus Doudnabacteria bacterium]|nr:50S ribosomal protein L21 [Candidatus Doudnabacteria bacterium]
MSTYAVVQIGPRQYIVEPDKTYDVEHFVANVGDKMTLDVLAMGSDKGMTWGTPIMDKNKVEIEIIEQGKGEKVVSRQFKAKSRYRRTRGFRKQVTTFKVVSFK